ncbi:RteC domain-containing protein [Desertivirga xinjiangensis]|uniref:RteC domain-containing protein n=1 Tax=Desertivirga xinjiangensis TaxID=539206 RepID=UPI00210C3B31|nr:RteC domain-containing protein [Pedobacter xinjiangensis]
MLQQPYDFLLEQQRDELNLIQNANANPTQKLRGSLDLVQKNLDHLKIIAKAGFPNVEEEIQFFKHVKPEFYSDKIYVVELHALNSDLPLGKSETVDGFLEAELQYIQRFFQAYSFYYQYYKLGFTELDHSYFLRNVKPVNLTLEIPESDPDFSTSLDYHFAKFIAYEKVRLTIVSKLHNLQTPNQTALSSGDSRTSLKWTGDSINLVEIAYGIWLTGQFNNGNAGISEIVRFLEDSFQVKIGRAHRRWTEIAQRKRESHTRHLDKMQEAILQRIDGELDLKK